MPLQFRNVDATPDDAVETWPYEALVTAIERGLVPDWRPIFAEVRRAPWGRVARRVERHLETRERDGAGELFRMAIERARADAERAERAEVAERVRDAVGRSRMTQAQFAEHVGTSASRLSTYCSGSVTPSAALLLRIERVGSSHHRSRFAP